MSSHARLAAAAALACLAVAAFLGSGDGRAMTSTTFGTVPSGFGGLYALLQESGFPVQRLRRRAAALDVDRPIWWLDTPVLCDDVVAPGPDTWSMLDWVGEGGTAVVALPPSGAAPCTSVAGWSLPRAEQAAASGLSGATALRGPLVAAPRTIAPEWLPSFDAAEDWFVVASLGDQPFILERRVGAGLLVVVADATVFSNRWLGEDDNAVLAIDLARAYGAPRFDEHAHGFRLHESAATYLASSPAAVVFLGLGLLAILYVWRSRLLPERTLGVADDRAPVLQAYIDSVAQMLAATRDHPRVVDAYRALTFLRLRRHFGLPAGLPLEALGERLRTNARVSPQGLATFLTKGTARNGRDVRRAVRELDRLVWEATR